jgi:indole-3-acetate monooxygenase
MTTSVTDWVEVARSFLPRIAAARDQAERERRVPHELIREMAEAGLFRLKLPRKYGGAEVDHLTYYRVVEEVSCTDPSAGWLVMIGNENASAAGYLPAEAADEIFGPDPSVILAVSLKSRHDDVRQVDGGYRVSGQWALASGCPEAAWMGVVAAIRTNALTSPDPHRAPELHAFFLPKQACTILDTWDALGLRATASHDFVVDDAFVPDYCQFAFPGSSELPGPLWRGDIRTQLGGLAAVSLGIARGSIDELVALSGNTVPLFSRTSLRDRVGVQARIGQAEALVRSARAFVDEVLTAMWQTQCQGEAPPAEQLALRELAVVNAAQASAQAVGLMFDAAGSNAVYATSKLERDFRDVHVITQHIAGSSSRYEQLGRFFMGLEMGPR